VRLPCRAPPAVPLAQRQAPAAHPTALAGAEAAAAATAAAAAAAEAAWGAGAAAAGAAQGGTGAQAEQPQQQQQQQQRQRASVPMERRPQGARSKRRVPEAEVRSFASCVQACRGVQLHRVCRLMSVLLSRALNDAAIWALNNRITDRELP